jgi:zinc protease
MSNALTPIEKPPSPGAPHRADLPTPVERTLANGLRAIVFRQHSGPKAVGVPLVAAQLILRGGSSAEADGEAGLASLTATLLTQGTAKRDAVAFAQTVDGLGARFDASPGYDAMTISVSALTNVFPVALALLDEVARTPAFAEHEVERVRAKAIGDLTLTYSNPSALARLVAQRTAFGGGPYGHPLAGTATTLAALDRTAVVAFHARFFRPDNATLIVGGDVQPDEAFALIEREFGGWQAPAAPLAAVSAVERPAPRARVVIVDKPDSGRTAIVIGRLGIARRAADYVDGVVATAVLSGYSGRLNQEVRVKRGLSYGAGAQLLARRLPGAFFASTLVDHARVHEAVDVMLTTLRGLAAEAPADAELVTRKATVTGSFSRSIESIDGVVGVLGELALYDVPLDELGAYLPHVEAVTPERVRAFVAAHMANDPFVVLVGDAQRFGASFAGHADVTTIPFADLDLASATLAR